MPGGGSSGGMLSPYRAARETIKVVNEQGQIVHDTTRTIRGIWSETKAAYKAKKLEIAEQRSSERRARESLGLQRRNTTHHSSSSHRSGHREIEDSHDSLKHRKRHTPRRQLTHHSSSGSSTDGHVSEDEIPSRAVGLRRSGSNTSLRNRDNSVLDPRIRDEVMQMGPALIHDPSVRAVSDILAHVQALIDELACWTAGITTLISELQKRPDMIAAVGLSLAEITGLIGKVAPVVLPVLKGAFPTIFALISSPHFSVVAGIGAAATVVVLGGYKIVKSVMAGAQENYDLAYGEDPDAGMEETQGPGRVLGEVQEDKLIMPAERERKRGTKMLENGPASPKVGTLERRESVQKSPKMERKDSKKSEEPEKKGSWLPFGLGGGAAKPELERKESSSPDADPKKKREHRKRDKDDRHERTEKPVDKEQRRLDKEERRLEREERRRKEEKREKRDHDDRKDHRDTKDRKDRDRKDRDRRESRDHRDHKDRKDRKGSVVSSTSSSSGAGVPSRRKSAAPPNLERRGTAPASMQRKNSAVPPAVLERKGSSPEVEKKKSLFGKMKKALV